MDDSVKYSSPETDSKGEKRQNRATKRPERQIYRPGAFHARRDIKENQENEKETSFENLKPDSVNLRESAEEVKRIVTPNVAEFAGSNKSNQRNNNNNNNYSVKVPKSRGKALHLSATNRPDTSDLSHCNDSSLRSERGQNDSFEKVSNNINNNNNNLLKKKQSKKCRRKSIDLDTSINAEASTEAKTSEQQKNVRTGGHKFSAQRYNSQRELGAVRGPTIEGDEISQKQQQQPMNESGQYLGANEKESYSNKRNSYLDRRSDTSNADTREAPADASINRTRLGSKQNSFDSMPWTVRNSEKFDKWRSGTSVNISNNQKYQNANNIQQFWSSRNNSGESQKYYNNFKSGDRNFGQIQAVSNDVREDWRNHITVRRESTGPDITNNNMDKGNFELPPKNSNFPPKK